MSRLPTKDASRSAAIASATSSRFRAGVDDNSNMEVHCMDSMAISALREEQRARRPKQSESRAIRLHRALSWLQRATYCTDDPDTCFIHLWIAFNAAYAGEFDHGSERDKVTSFLRCIVAADSGQQLHALLFRQFSGPIRTLLGNRYVFEPYWRGLQQHDASERWKARFEASNKAAMACMLEGRTADLLGVVLDRLYVLRNQLVHGGATWNSALNRSQLHDGCMILGALVPVIVAVMMRDDAFDDDPVAYPAIPDITLPVSDARR